MKILIFPASYRSGTRIGMSDRGRCSSRLLARIALIAVAGALSGGRSASAQNLIPDGIYTITNQASFLYMDVAGSSTANGALIDQWGTKTDGSETWQLTNLGSNYVKLINVHTGLALEVANSSTSSGVANIDQYTYGGGANQIWQVVRTGSTSNNVVSLVNKNSGLALDDSGASTIEGADLIQWSQNGGTNQMWGFRSATATSIAAAPVDPQATPATVALYKYMTSTFGKKIIGGTAGGSAADYVYNTCGQYPLAKDYEMGNYSPEYAWYWSSDAINPSTGQPGYATFAPLSNDSNVPNAINWYLDNNCQPIISFQWHWYSPMGGTVGTNTFDTSNTTFDVSQAVIPGTPEYNATLRDIDAIAVQLKRLSDANVPVLWRPLHEAGGTWFWWNAKGGAAYIALWNLMYNRLVNVDGIHNLIWVWNGDGADFYPGNNVVDVLSIDENSSTQTEYNKVLWISGGQKLLAASEFGSLPDVNSCLTTQATPWDYFNIWGSVAAGNTDQQITSCFTNPNTVTLQNTTLPAQKGPIALAPGTYEIINRLSGLALDADGAGTTNGTIVDQWTSSGGPNQQWTVTPIGNGQYQIMNYNANLALDVPGSGGSGTFVDLWSYGGTTNQAWVVHPVGGYYYEILPAYNTSLALDDYGGSTSNYDSSTNNGRIDVYALSGNSNQQWSFQFVAALSDTTPPTTTASIANNTDGSVTVSLSTSDPDNFSGQLTTYYTLDGGTQQTYNTPFTVTGAGSHTVSFWSADVAGNVESAHTLTLKVIVNVTGQVAITRGSVLPVLPSSGYYQMLSVKNTSASAIAGPIELVLTGLPSGVTVTNAAGTYNGNPYVVVTSSTLAGGTPVNVRVNYADPTKERVSYAITAYSGAF